jgi:hypothetical protein
VHVSEVERKLKLPARDSPALTALAKAAARAALRQLAIAALACGT